MAKFKSYSAKFFQDESEVLRRATRNMAGSIINKSQLLNPVDTGALRSSSRVKTNRKGGHAAIVGGADVGIPYARRQEFEHRTKKHYLQRAGDATVKQGFKTFYEMSK
jgi:hypothetical protein